MLAASLIAGLLTAGSVAAAPPVPAVETIPAGTSITYANWHRYEAFMPPAMRKLFAGDGFWKMPSNVAIEVGPTTPIALPPKYLADTAKFAKQVSLVKSPQGGYAPKGYVAGVPFPDFEKTPKLEPYEIFYDDLYRYTPRLQRELSCEYTADSYGDVTLASTVDSVYSQLTYLSDVGYPQTIPGSNGHSLVKYFEQIAPDAGKYTTSLIIEYADPERLADIYVYMPATRRPIRLSGAHQCSPEGGTDYVWDDSDLGPPSLPQEFEIKYLGERRILALAHMNTAVLKSCGTSRGLPPEYFYPAAKGIAAWPKPALGKWELRSVYVIEMSRLPAFASNYCYSKRVLYVDKHTFFPLAFELYDTKGQLAKYFVEFIAPMRVPKTGVALSTNGAIETFIVNFKDKHMTLNTAQDACYNTECSANYFDISRYASPAGLMKIVQ
ncbi:MAG: DUF1329 domain-containing protein [Candidatus Binataceae bacterium]